jgi:hypothetical protein
LRQSLRLVAEEGLARAPGTQKSGFTGVDTASEGVEEFNVDGWGSAFIDTPPDPKWKITHTAKDYLLAVHVPVAEDIGAHRAPHVGAISPSRTGAKTRKGGKCEVIS